MSDLIDRQAAIRWVKTECNPYGKPTIDFESGKKVIEHLEQMPSAQPEIIRCKDCKYSSHEPYKDQADVYVCNYSYWTRAEGGRYPDWYCARAERRTDD